MSALETADSTGQAHDMLLYFCCLQLHLKTSGSFEMWMWSID